MELKWITSKLVISNVPNKYFDDSYCGKLVKEHLLDNENDFEDDYLELYPSKTSIYVDDPGRIDSSTDFIELLEYYSSKQNLGTENYLIIVNEKKCILEKLDNYVDDNIAYQEMTSPIIIDIPNANKSSLNFSPLIFRNIQDKLIKNNIEFGEEINFLTQFISLIPISDKVIYNKDTKIFSFIFINSQKEKRSFIELKWKEYKKLSNDFFYQSYLWIISDKNKGISTNVRRNIVNNYLNNVENLETIISLTDSQVKDMVTHFDDILKMVIANRTKEYFDNKRMMKEEFVRLFSKSNEIYSGIVQRILSLIVVIAVGIYGVVFVDGQAFDWTQKNRNMAILFIIFLIGELFVCFSFITDIISFQKYKNKLKKIYGMQLLMNTKEWDEIMKTRNYSFPILSLIFVIIGTCVVIRYFW